MKSAIETFVGIILIVLMVVIATCYITASIDTRQAQNFHSSVVTEIEASHFASSVIDELEQKAHDNGFTMIDGSGNKVSGLTVNVMSSMDVAEVTLTYDYTIPFLNIFLKHEIVGYAR